MTDGRPGCPVGYTRARNPAVRQAAGKASARAAAQLPYTSVTVLAAGQAPSCRRASDFGPRLLAWVHDQSYDEGGLP